MKLSSRCSSKVSSTVRVGSELRRLPFLFKDTVKGFPSVLKMIEPLSFVLTQTEIHYCVTEAPLLSNRRTWFLTRALLLRHSVFEWQQPQRKDILRGLY